MGTDVMKMRCIRGVSKSAYYNFACEEYFMKHYSEPVFMLWENQNCVMVGKTQNTYAEIDTDYVRKHDISVVRRQSGGGTIYTSEGIIQFSFISKRDDSMLTEKMRKYAQPLVAYLATLGIKAEFSGRNDVLINGMKVNGNAQAYNPNVMLHHGSILFDADLDHAVNALTPKKEKLEAKGIKSVRSRMTLIRNHLKTDMSPTEFFNSFFDYILESNPDSFEKQLSEYEDRVITKLCKDKWETWEWNFGKNPKFNFRRGKKFAGGYVEVVAEIKKGRIESIRVFGDFFGTRDIKELEALLVGNEHNLNTFKQVLSNVDLNEFINNVTKDEFLELIFD